MRTLCAAVILTAWVGMCRADGPLFDYSFEQGANLAGYAALSVSGTGEIVAPGARSEGHCLCAANPQPSLYDSLEIRVPFTLVRNLVLSFDYRVEVEAPGKGAYVAFMFDADTKKQYGFWGGAFTDQWTHLAIPLADLRSQDRSLPAAGMKLVRLGIYARAAGKPARMKLWIDNIRLETAPRAGTLSDEIRTSTANPPLFCWEPGSGEMTLAFAQDPAFPASGTVTVKTKRNFVTPPAPLTPGVWYWRVWSETDLASGWSDTRRIDVLPQAHRFTTAAVDESALAKRAHPRIFDVTARHAEPGVQGVASLRSRALADARQPIPDDPKRYDPKSGKYPEWIDWYKDTCNRICGGTGLRMERAAEAYALTKDAEVGAAAKTLCLTVSGWDPQGGSAMDATDIGAHHLLRGLSACYDCLYDELTPAERARVAAAITARALQFYHHLCPFRGSAENNHAWLQAYGLAMAGVALCGDVPQADEWVEYVRQLYLGRFLCALGYQGDNNEGITYWSYGLSFVISYADLMRQVCGIDLYRHPWLAQTDRFPMYCAPPGAWAVSFADTGLPNHGIRGPTAQTDVGELAERVGDPYGLWYAGIKEGAHGLRPRPPVDLDPSIHYDYIGWVIFNTSLVDGREGVTFAMRSGPFYAGHQHDDQNGFVLHAYGDKLAVDSGYYDWYGSPHFKEYSTRTRAHNTILVDGKDQAHMKHGADGRITAYFSSPDYGFTIGDASNPAVYEGRLDRFDRCVLFIKPRYVIVQDLLRAHGNSARYDWLLHTVAPVEMQPDQSFRLTSGAARLTGRFLSPSDLQFKVTAGYPVPPCEFQSSKLLPPDQVVKEWTLTATPAQARKTEEFLAVLQVDRSDAAGASAAVSALTGQGAHGVRIDGKSAQHLVGLSDAKTAAPWKLADLESDGVAAAVAERQGRVMKAFAQHARFLRYRGTPIAAADKPVDCAVAFSDINTAVANITTTDAAVVRLGCPHAPAAVQLDGAACAVRYANGQITVDLQPGTHEIAYGTDPATAVSHALSTAAVGVAGKDFPLEGYDRRTADGHQSYWWGTFEVAHANRFHLVPRGWIDTTAPRFTINSQPVPPAADGSVSQWLLAGQHEITLAGAGRLEKLELQPEAGAMIEASLLAQNYAPPRQAIVVEAEQVAAEGPVKGKIVEKVAASGGKAHCNRDTDGQWAEWTFAVTHTGRYRLLVRAASENPEIVRELLLDGKPLPSGAAVRFTGTGGWCRTANDWRYFDVTGKDGVALAPGKHTIRMTRIAGSMNLDLFAWVAE